MESSPPLPASTATNLDVVLLPFPSQGHLNPFMLMARLLASRGLNCTIVLTQTVYNMVMKEETTSSSSSSSRNNGIQFVAIREDPPTARSTMSLGNNAMSGFDAALHVMLKMRAGFEDLIKNLPCPPCCLIADAFVLWSQESAQKLGLLRVSFFTAAAFSFSIMFHFPMLFSTGLVPFTDASYENPQYFIDCIPGMPPLRPIDFSDSMRNMPQFVLQVADLIETAAAVLLNTTYELEKEPLDALQKKVPVFPVGPLLLCEERSSHIVNFWTEETECLNWLDAQSPSSVLYVSFGSMAAMSAKQLIELAEGLGPGSMVQNSARAEQILRRESLDRRFHVQPGSCDFSAKRCRFATSEPQLFPGVPHSQRSQKFVTGWSNCSSLTK